MSRTRVYNNILKPNITLKTGRLIITLVVFTAAFLWMSAPTLKLIRERSMNNNLKLQLQNQLLENNNLKSDILKLKKPSYIEIKARKDLGLVKPGEIQYYVLMKKVKGKARPKAKPQSWWRKTMRFLEVTFAK